VSGLERPIAADWLALREPADTRARDAAAETLLPPLLAQLGTRSGAPLRVLDLGVGTGANLRWLAPRLPTPDQQHWTLVDHDPDLLARAAAQAGPVQTTAVQADVTDLAGLLEDGADLVTAAALLDLLDRTQLGAVVDAVLNARIPALFSLTVTGEVVLTPPESADRTLAEAFDAHQRRGARLGPDAARVAVDLFRERGWRVVQARTPWVLTAGHNEDLLRSWLEGRAEAAIEQQPDLELTAADWLGRRHLGLISDSLMAVVGHLDVLALPE
jgi:SAM-dependent methyltransferase